MRLGTLALWLLAAGAVIVVAGVAVAGACTVTSLNCHLRGDSPTVDPLASTSLCLTCHDLPKLIAQPRPGYWHFEKVHHEVVTTKRDCVQCHADLTPTDGRKLRRHGGFFTGEFLQIPGRIPTELVLRVTNYPPAGPR